MTHYLIVNRKMSLYLNVKSGITEIIFSIINILEEGLVGKKDIFVINHIN